MADATSTLRINVQVQGADQVRGFASAFAQIRTGATAPAAVVAGVRRGGANATADRTAQNAANQVARFITGAIAQPLVAPINVVGASVRMASGSLVSFLGPLASAATAVVGGTGSIIAAGVAIYAVGIPLFNLAATWKILRVSWGLAADRAEEQFRTIARTRRTFPGLVGEAFEQAQNRMETKLDVTEALFGDAAASLDERITRLFTDVRLQRGMRGERDIFARWGITPQAVQLMERERGGERMNVTDWLAFFIKRREQLDARILASPVGSAEHMGLVRRRAVLFDDSIKLFGTTFTDLLGVWNTEDLKRLTDNMEKSNSLSDVEDAAQKSIDFKIALETTRYTFERLRLGIGRDVQPALTGMMTELNDWLLQTDDQGQSMGMILRQLLTAFAKKTWEAIVVLVDQIDTETVKAWVEYIKTGWNPQESISLIEWGISAVEKVTNMFDALAHTFFQMKKLGPWQLALLFASPVGYPILRGAGVLEEWTPGAGRRAAANAAAEAQGLPPPYPEVGRRRSMLEQYGLPGVDETWGGRGGAGGPSGIPRAAGGASGRVGAEAAVDEALKLEGMHEQRDRETIKQYLRSGGVGMDPAVTAWCAAFVNASLDRAGLPGTGSQVARSFMNYGTAVSAANVRKGDILVEHKGQMSGPGGHVGFATGRVSPEGKIEMFSGNVLGGKWAAKTWYSPSQLAIRRPPEVTVSGQAGPGNAVLSEQQAAASARGAGAAVGAGGVIPASMQTPEVMAALREVGTKHGIHPMAIAGVINTESKWSTRAVTGRYRGLTQIGPENPEWSTIGNMSAADQVRTYGRWLDRYRFGEKRQRAGVDFSSMTAAQQAAYLQGFQFAPNAMQWQYAAGRGQFGIRSTLSRQARALGSTTLAEMTRYYDQLIGRGVPPEQAAREAGARIAGTMDRGTEEAAPPRPIAAAAETRTRERESAERLAADAAEKQTETAAELLKTKQAERNREALTRPPPKKSIDEGKAAGEAAANAFKEGVKEVSIPVKSLKEGDEDKERERTRDEEEKKAA